MIKTVIKTYLEGAILNGISFLTDQGDKKISDRYGYSNVKQRPAIFLPSLHRHLEKELE